MGWFGRGRRDRAPLESAGRDAAFPFLDADRAARLRMLVHRAFAEQGVEVVVYEDHVVDVNGRRFGLANLAAVCYRSDKDKRWPSLVEDHVVTILRAVDAPDPFADATFESVSARTVCRVYDHASLPDPLLHTYVRELAPGLVEVLALDLPDSVAVFRDEHVEACGGLLALRAVGRVNLAAEPIDQHKILNTPEGAELHAFTGNSMFVASKVLLLEDLLSEVLGIAEAPDGVLVAMPNRHELMLHVLRDATAMPALDILAAYTPATFAETPGPLSPFVYWWRKGTFTQLSHSGVGDTEGESPFRVEIGLELGEVLARLAVIEGPGGGPSDKHGSSDKPSDMQEPSDKAGPADDGPPLPPQS